MLREDQAQELRQGQEGTEGNGEHPDRQVELLSVSLVPGISRRQGRESERQEESLRVAIVSLI